MAAKAKAKSEADALDAAFEAEIARQMESVKVHAKDDLKGVICLVTSLMRDAERTRKAPEGFVEALGIIRKDLQSCLLSVTLVIDKRM